MCEAYRRGPTVPQIISVEKIWSHAPHNAFTDLIRFRDRWWCVFREAQAHDAPGGILRVLKSETRERSVGVGCNGGGTGHRPARSQAFGNAGRAADAPNGRLRIRRRRRVSDTCAPSLVLGGWRHLVGPPQGAGGRPLALAGNVARRPGILALESSVRGRGLGGGSCTAARTESTGIWITEFKLPGVSETTLGFQPDGEMVALIRPRYIGTSRPPYREWSFCETPGRIGGPNFIRLPDGSLWGSGRLLTAHGARTVLARMTTSSYEPALTLPSGGDTSYAGMVWHDDTTMDELLLVA